MTDLNKILVFSAIMGVLLIAGLMMGPSDPQPAVVEPVVQETTAEVTVLSQESLEMLDPVYSEKAVFNDDTIRIAFNASLIEEGAESRLPFWLHNLSNDVITVLWDRCSIQLPNGNTMKIVNEESLTYDTSSDSIAIAPKGDLFDAVVPVSEIAWDDDGTWVTTLGVFDQGTFTFVLAVEVSHCPAAPARIQQGCADQAQVCTDGTRVHEHATCETSSCGETQIAYYTFRFVIR